MTRPPNYILENKNETNEKIEKVEKKMGKMDNF